MSDDFDWSRLTEEALEVLSDAHREAHDWGDSQTSREHLVLAFLRVNKGVAAGSLKAAGLAVGLARSRVATRFSRQHADGLAPLGLTPVLIDALALAVREGGGSVTTAHLLRALIGLPDAREFFDAFDVSLVVLQKELAKHKDHSEYRHPVPIPEGRREFRRRLAEVEVVCDFIAGLGPQWRTHFALLETELRDLTLQAAQFAIRTILTRPEGVSPAENVNLSYTTFCGTLDVALSDARELLRAKGFDPDDRPRRR